MQTPRWIAPVALIALVACSVEGSEEPAEAPAPGAEAAVEESLPTPEEEAAKAAESIDEANAEAELQRLQKELEGG